MNKKIKNSRFHSGRAIKVNNDLLTYLEEQNLDLDTIPAKSERIFLRRHGTYLGLRLNVDCTDNINPRFKEYAVQAINSIEGIPYGSVDMIIDEDNNKGVVNEINTHGEISMHITPIEGKPRDIPKAIIDYYFPNTKRLSDTLYFEMKPIKDLFIAGLAEDIAVPSIPNQKLYQQKFTITGEKLDTRYLKKLQKHAARYHLMGTIDKTDNKTIIIKLSGSKSMLNKYKKFLKRARTNKAIIKKVEATNLVDNSQTKQPIHLELKNLSNKTRRQQN